jgi:hypothetical protein
MTFVWFDRFGYQHRLRGCSPSRSCNCGELFRR